MVNTLPKGNVEYSAYNEMRLAARHAGIEWPRFKLLSGEDKAEIIMGYRADMLTQALQDKEQADEIERKNKPRAKG